MPDQYLDHLIYAPVPFKGYMVRARSPGAIDEEYKEASKDWFVPFDETLFGGYDYQARVINLPFNSKKLYLSRVFRRAKLDDLGRDGQVSHVAAIPTEWISQGLAMKDVDQSLAAFEQKNGIPVGDMPKVEASWDSGRQNDPDVGMMKSVIPRESARKLIDFLNERDEPRVFVVFKRSYKDRIELAYMLSKLLFKVEFSSFIVTSDSPMEIILNTYSNVVISDYLPRLKPNSNWKILNLTPAGVATGVSLDKTKIDDTLKGIYGS